MKDVLLFTAIEGTGRESLAYSNFIKPLGTKTISFITIRDLLKGNFYKKSFILPIINTETHPDRIHFFILLCETLFYLSLFYPFLRNKKIFVRGIPLGFFFSLIRKKYYLFMPGIYSKEGKIYLDKDEKFLRSVEKRAISGAQKVFVPDYEIKDFIIKNYNFKNVDVVFIPVDTDFFRMKEKYRNKTMVYLGTIPDKNTEEDIFKTFYKFKEYIKGLKLVILTRKEFKGKDVYSFYLNKDRLKAFLPGLNFGLIMEGRNENSRYLLTTKFSEYAASGIPVIVHKGISALKEIVEKEKLGIVIDPDYISEKDILRILENYNDYSRNIRRFAEENLSYNVYREKVLND